MGRTDPAEPRRGHRLSRSRQHRRHGLTGCQAHLSHRGRLRSDGVPGGRAAGGSALGAFRTTCPRRSRSDPVWPRSGCVRGRERDHRGSGAFPTEGECRRRQNPSCPRFYPGADVVGRQHGHRGSTRLRTRRAGSLQEASAKVDPSCSAGRCHGRTGPGHRRELPHPVRDARRHQRWPVQDPRPRDVDCAVPAVRSVGRRSAVPGSAPGRGGGRRIRLEIGQECAVPGGGLDSQAPWRPVPVWTGR